MAAAPVDALVVAVDGPSGSGKSSVSRGVAQARGLRYLDTGAMYRAMTWWMLEHDVDVSDADAVAALADKPALVVGTDPRRPAITVDGIDVATAIRERPVTNAVSAVSAVPRVRRLLTDAQRALIRDGGIVVEGRDIGTVVAPDAHVKIYLTASPEARAERRTAELVAADVSQTQRDLARRDALDSARAAAPLAKAPDAHEIDATTLGLQEVIDAVLRLVEHAARGARA